MFRRTFTTATPQKLGFFAKTKQQAQFILKGIKLFTQETKDAQLIRSKIRDSGYKVNRQEFVFLHRNKLDIRKVVPFFFITVILPEIIPFLILRGSSIIPSTCITNEQLVTKRAKSAKDRVEIKDELIKLGVANMTEFKQLDAKQARLLCRYFGFPTARPRFMLCNSLSRHAEFIAKDNQFLSNETSILSPREVTDALEQRGISVIIDNEDQSAILKQYLTSVEGKSNLEMLLNPIL